MEELVGKLLSERYLVDSFLGRGGMAEVYKVWDQYRSAYLALKLLNSDLSEDIVFLRRFKREGKTLAALQHPNIVRFYGLEETDDRVFLLMDFVDGITLRKEIKKNGIFSARQVFNVMKPVCSALNYAHHEGQVHCDIKPANIMINQHGQVFITDFGISRQMESATTTTMVGAGTPAYMAPEQIAGAVPTAQTDVYALGIVLFEMLTGGERPFIGEQATITGSTSEKVLWEQRNLRPPSVCEFNSGLSNQINDVVMKCLEKKPENRYSTTMDLLTDLCQVLGEQESPVKPQPIVKEIVPEQPKVMAEVPDSIDIPEKLTEPDEEADEDDKKPNPVISRILGIATLVIIIAALVAVFVSLIKNSKYFTQTKTPQTTVPAATQPVFERFYKDVPTEKSEMDGMELVYIAPGDFVMGSNQKKTVGTEHNDMPEHTVYLDGYWIDKTPITIAMYKKCVDANKCTKPFTNGGGDILTARFLLQYNISDFNNYPVVGITWRQATDYCSWARRRLPTEAEWEKAARGTDGRTYPWGESEPASNLLNANNTSDDGYSAWSPVGEYLDGASPYRVLDMAGNVQQWTADWYDADYYSNSPLRNPTGPQTVLLSQRVLRGGSYFDIYSDPEKYSNFTRNGLAPDLNSPTIGFRCAVSD